HHEPHDSSHEDCIAGGLALELGSECLQQMSRSRPGPHASRGIKPCRSPGTKSAPGGATHQRVEAGWEERTVSERGEKGTAPEPPGPCPSNLPSAQGLARRVPAAEPEAQ